MKKVFSVFAAAALLFAAASCDSGIYYPIEKPSTPVEDEDPGEEDPEPDPVIPDGEEFRKIADVIEAMSPGWNLGNTLESNSGETDNMWLESWSDHSTSTYETAWGQPVATRELIHMFAEAGFKAIRVPVTWYPHMGELNVKNGVWNMDDWVGDEVDPVWMARVHEVVDYVIDEGLYCILNVHHDTGDYSAAWLRATMDGFNFARDRYASLWKQIAIEFRDYDEHLLFEGYNEMLDSYGSWCFASYASPSKYDEASASDSYKAINRYAQLFLDSVRETGGNNYSRNLVVCTYGGCSGDGTWNKHLQDPLKNMILPSDTAPSGHVAFEVHSYWDCSKFGDSQKKEIDKLFSNVKQYLSDPAGGVPVIIGEWGNNNSSGSTADQEVAFAGYFASQARANGCPNFWWMSLSDGSDRSVPKWTRPDIKDAIIGAYE